MASGIINGTVSGSNARAYKFWVEWTSIAYTSENYSRFSATAYLQRIDGYNDSAYNLGVSKDDKKITANDVTAESSSNGIDTRNQKKVVIASISNLKVIHDADGYGYVDVSASFPYVVEQLTGGTLSKQVTLDVIDQSAPTVTARIYEVTQTSFKATLTANAKCNKWRASYDGGKTWQTWSSLNTTEVNFILYDREPNTNYSILFEVTRSSNSLVGFSKIYTFKTLPIYATDIIIDDSVTVDLNGTKKLEYQIVPPEASIKEIIAVPENVDIISADGDVLFGVNKGQTSITVSTIDGSGISKVITGETIQKVSGITTNQTQITIPIGGKADIEYTVLPQTADDRRVEITSDDTGIVVIENNSILGIENGSAIVTITTVDGGYKAEIVVTVSGDYVWYDYSTPLEILNASDINNIMSNTRTIRSMLLSKGYITEALNEVVATKDVPIIDIFDILQNIEYNLDIINDNDAKSRYYVEPKTVGEYASNKEDIWRWIQILNDMYYILSGDFGKWQYILCSDGFPTIDGKRILVRGDFVG